MAAEYGKPQALTWNMGTTGNTQSRALMFSASGNAPAKACNMVERWLYKAALGLPWCRWCSTCSRPSSHQTLARLYSVDSPQSTLVATQPGNSRVGGQFVCIAQRNPVLDGGAMAVHGLDDGQESHVKAQHLVFGMVGNPGDLLGMQPRIEGVQHPARYH